MAFADLSSGGYSLAAGTYKIEEADICVHQDKAKEGVAKAPYTAARVKVQPLTSDHQPDGDVRERFFRLDFKGTTDLFLPSEDGTTAVGSSVGAAGPFYAALKTDPREPNKDTGFGIWLQSALVAGLSAEVLNSKGMGAFAGLIVDIDIQTTPNRQNPNDPYKNEIIKKIHTAAPTGAAAAATAAKAKVSAAAKKAGAGAGTAAAPTAPATQAAPTPTPAGADTFDGDSWLTEALMELAGKFTGQTKPATLVHAQLQVIATKQPQAKAWLAGQPKTVSAEKLVELELAVQDGNNLTFV